MSTLDASTIKTLALGDLDQELARTRALLERVPDKDGDWRPHAKSFTLRELSAHLENLLLWLLMTVRESEFDMAAAPPTRFVPETTAELLQQYDDKVKLVTEAVAQMTTDDMLADWTLRHGDHVIFTMPRAAVLRSFGISHMAHHRGQLSVYLRMRDVPLPQTYGPTADEPDM